MSKKKTKNSPPPSGAIGATDLLERLRQVQSNQEQVNQKKANEASVIEAKMIEKKVHENNVHENKVHENKAIEKNSTQSPVDSTHQTGLPHTVDDQEMDVFEPPLLSKNDSGKQASNKQTLNAENESSFERGKVPPEARRALVSLLKHGVILGAQKNTLFECVCRYQSAIRSHLADVYLKLVLDEKSGVAFVAQMDESEHDDTDAVSLMTRRTLTLYDTLVLLVLRKHYQERESAGEQRVVIDIERIEANLTPFIPLTNSMKSDQRKLSSSLNKMVEKHLLSKVRGSDDRFEITPIIRYIVNADFLEQMLKEYQKLADKADVVVQSKASVKLTESGSARESS